MKIFILSLLLSFLAYASKAQPIQVLPLGSGTDDHPQIGRGAIRKLYVDAVDNVLYAVGSFVKMGGKMVYGVAKWDGTSWDSLGSGIKESDQYDFIQTPLDVIRYKNEIYLTGAFYKCGRKDIKGIARWNGTEWNDVGGSMKGRLPSGSSMVVHNNELYLIGSFDTIGNIPSKGIAKWDGQNWTDLSQNFPSYCSYGQKDLYELIFFNNELYVGGNMNCDIFPSERLLKRVGNQWLEVGQGFSGDATLNTFEIFNSNLIVAGYFFPDGFNIENSIVRCDGLTYHPMAGGLLPANVMDLIEYESELYAVGQIDLAGYQSVSTITKWDGANWFNTSLTVLKSQVGDGTILNLAIYNGKLIVGGSFDQINGVEAQNIASIDFNVVGLNSIAKGGTFKLYPNPAQESFRFKLSDNEQFRNLNIYNAIGQKVLESISIPNQTVDIAALNRGLYYVEIQTNHGKSRQKLLVE